MALFEKVGFFTQFGQKSKNIGFLKNPKKSDFHPIQSKIEKNRVLAKIRKSGIFHPIWSKIEKDSFLEKSEKVVKMSKNLFFQTKG